MDAWFTTALDIEECLAGGVDSDVHLFVADVVKSFDTVDRGILDRVLSSLGLPAWFSACLLSISCSCSASVQTGCWCLGEPWTREGGIPQRCPLSMMFIVVLYLPWCRYLGELPDVSTQLYADNLKCVSTRPEQLLRGAQFTSAYVMLVGQEPAPSKCILMSTLAVIRQEMKEWVISDQECWTVKLDVRDLGGHLDTTYRAWGRTLVARVFAVLRVVWLVSALPLDYRSKLRILRSIYIPDALHGVEASHLSQSNLLKLRAAFVRACWSSKLTLAHTGAVLGILDGPECVDPSACIVWYRFRLMRRYLACRPLEAARVGRLLDLVSGGAPGHGPVSAASLGCLSCPWLKVLISILKIPS